MSEHVPIPRSVPHSASAPPITNPSSFSQTPPSFSQRSSTTSSRRASQMLPPPLPHSYSASSTPSLRSPLEPGIDPGPGPQRLPRQLTAAEIHQELEREQEGIVNRLTRELSLLRSRSQDSPTDPEHPTRLRSSSQTSGTSLSRQSSIRTGRSSPPGFQPTTGAPDFSLSSSFSSETSGLEEAIRWKRELDEKKRENDALRNRVKELERMVRKMVKERSKEKEAGKEGKVEKAEGSAIKV